MTDWTKEFPGAVTVCDRHGVITQMNDKSARTFEADGGRALVGTNLLGCHPEPSRSLVADLLAIRASTPTRLRSAACGSSSTRHPGIATAPIRASSSCRSRSRVHAALRQGRVGAAMRYASAIATTAAAAAVLATAASLVATGAIGLNGSAAPRTQLVLLGTGTPNADPERFGPAVAIIVDDVPYLVDVGPGLVRRAAAACARGIKGLDPKLLRTAFITHLHSDHTAGYPDLVFTPAVLERDAPLQVYGPPVSAR